MRTEGLNVPRSLRSSHTSPPKLQDPVLSQAPSSLQGWDSTLLECGQLKEEGLGGFSAVSVQVLHELGLSSGLSGKLACHLCGLGMGS